MVDKCVDARPYGCWKGSQTDVHWPHRFETTGPVYEPNAAGPSGGVKVKDESKGEPEKKDVSKGEPEKKDGSLSLKSVKGDGDDGFDEVDLNLDEEETSFNETSSSKRKGKRFPGFFPKGKKNKGV